LYGPLADFYLENKDHERVLWMDKRHYSAFSGTDLDIRLRERGVDTVVLTGVLSDICVLHTAIDAYNKGYRIEVVASAIAALTEESHQFALNHLRHVLGATVIE
jgi:nicotinamidase-related amidase